MIFRTLQLYTILLDADEEKKEENKKKNKNKKKKPSTKFFPVTARIPFRRTTNSSHRVRTANSGTQRVPGGGRGTHFPRTTDGGERAGGGGH